VCCATLPTYFFSLAGNTWAFWIVDSPDSSTWTVLREHIFSSPRTLSRTSKQFRNLWHTIARSAGVAAEYHRELSSSPLISRHAFHSATTWHTVTVCGPVVWISDTKWMLIYIYISETGWLCTFFVCVLLGDGSGGVFFLVSSRSVSYW
jgi:hypothetical protein